MQRIFVAPHSRLVYLVYCFGSVLALFANLQGKKTKVTPTQPSTTTAPDWSIVRFLSNVVENKIENILNT